MQCHSIEIDILIEHQLCILTISRCEIPYHPILLFTLQSDPLGIRKRFKRGEQDRQTALGAFFIFVLSILLNHL